MYPSKPLPLAVFSKLLSTIAVALLVMVWLGSAAGANPKYASIVIDANTGKVLHSRHGDSLRYPASLTKMMTLYMLFDAMHQGKVTKSTRILISRHSASMQPSKLGIPAGKSISAQSAIYALVTKSANDVAAAVGEHLGGTEAKFAAMMTRKARALGMSKTTFRNASGLPNAKQLTTARDMATLGIALQEHFPKEFEYFSTRSFKFGKSHFRNHNRLLGKVRGVDGIKTGYTRASGFNLVTSVNDRGRSVVAVVMGGKSGASRNAHMEQLLAAHLGKGSKRKRTNLVARASGSNLAVKRQDVASLQIADLPLPVAPPRKNAVTAAAKQTPPASVPIENTAAKPVPRPAVAIDTITTGTTATHSGWIIQIASLPSQDEAVAYIKTAQNRAEPVLGKRDPFIEQFKKSGILYHRARFAGFRSKSEAWGACKALKKYNYSCLAFNKS